MASTTNLAALAVTGAYLVLTLVIGIFVSRRNSNVAQYMVAGRSLGFVAVGFVLMSEFLGLGSTVGTAEFAYKHGVGAAWQLVSIAAALVLFAFWMAPRYRAHPETTVSGIVNREYGPVARRLTSAMMIYALLSVSCALYAGGTATLVPLLGVPRWVALVIVAVVTITYLMLGGMRAVAITNALDAIMILLGTGLTAIVGLAQVGGFSELRSRLDPFMFDPTSMGWALIIGWFLANIGAIFATQYIVQALASTTDKRTARKASLVGAAAVLPVGFFATAAGMTAAVRFPGADPSQTFGLWATNTAPLIGGLIVTGVGAAMLGTIGAVTHASTQLLSADFIPLVTRRLGLPDSERRDLRLARGTNVLLALLPVPFVLLTPEILDLVFFARGVRAAIAVVVVYVLLGAKRVHPVAVVVGLAASVIASTAWYLAGSPWGVDETYISIGVPVLALAVGWILARRRHIPPNPSARASTPAHADRGESTPAEHRPAGEL